MGFIEAFFGFSPDHNSGVTEAAIMFAFSLVLIGIRRLNQLKRAKH